MVGVEWITHTQRVREDAAEGCIQTVVEMVRYEWQCPRCSLVCDKWDDYCNYCSWDRRDDGWLCGCGHLNQATAKDGCETCGLDKQVWR
jgi:hypothetical protein